MRVQIYYAAEDALSGPKGQEYFENVWKSENCGKGIEVNSIVIPDSDHDSAVNASKLGIGELLRTVKKEWF